MTSGWHFGKLALRAGGGLGGGGGKGSWRSGRGREVEVDIIFHFSFLFSFFTTLTSLPSRLAKPTNFPKMSRTKNAIDVTRRLVARGQVNDHGEKREREQSSSATRLGYYHQHRVKKNETDVIKNTLCFQRRRAALLSCVHQLPSRGPLRIC